MTCGFCGQVLQEIGTLGLLKYFRCHSCGMKFSVEPRTFLQEADRKTCKGHNFKLIYGQLGFGKR